MNRKSFEQEESKIYQAGTPVELKKNPGQVYFVEEYDSMMVPPVWLKNYPKPCYPEELKVLSNLVSLQSRQNLQPEKICT